MDGVAMGSPLLGPTIANAFICFHEKSGECPDEFKLVYYRGHVDDIFVLFRSRNHVLKFRDYLNKCHFNVKFSFEEEKNGKLSFLNVEVSREGNKFVSTAYRKPNFCGAYMHFYSFLSTTYKFGMNYILAFRYFSIYSNWTNFHDKLAFFLRHIFKKWVSNIIHRSMF